MARMPMAILNMTLGSLMEMLGVSVRGGMVTFVVSHASTVAFPFVGGIDFCA